MDQGNRLRATASTGMNNKSSRSHSVLTLTVTQTQVSMGHRGQFGSRLPVPLCADTDRDTDSGQYGLQEHQVEADGAGFRLATSVTVCWEDG